jgi:hypothetical protein
MPFRFIFAWFSFSFDIAAARTDYDMRCRASRDAEPNMRSAERYAMRASAAQRAALAPQRRFTPFSSVYFFLRHFADFRFSSFFDTLSTPIFFAIDATPITADFRRHFATFIYFHFR